jgi:hypothetical protein
MRRLLYILLFVPLALFGQENYSLTFDGVDDYVMVNSSESLHITSDLTISVKIYSRPEQTSSWPIFLSYGNNGEGEEDNQLYAIQYTDSAPKSLNCYHEYSSGENSPDYHSQSKINYNDFIYLTVTRNSESKQMLFYEDGVLIDSLDYSENPTGGEMSNLYIGSGPESNPYNGNIDYVQLWSTVLSQDEIQSYITCLPSGQEEYLEGFWNFNEGSGNTVYDLSGNANHGVISGATYSEDVPEQNCDDSYLNELSIIDQLNQSFDVWNTSIDLQLGWNMFGYGCPNPINIAEGLSNHTDIISIVKDNNGNVYMPEFSFNGIGDLTPGFGYQIKVTEVIEGFSLCNWYVNDIPEDNIVSLQEENASLQAFVDSVNASGCIDSLACNYQASSLYDDGSCLYPEDGFDCEGYVIAEIGDEFQGGLLFYIDETGKHGMVTAKNNYHLSWGCSYLASWGCEYTYVDGATDVSIGAGYSNTLAIVNSMDDNNCSTTDGELSGAEFCLNFEYDGFSDWHLPSINELLLLYETIPSSELNQLNDAMIPYFMSSNQHTGIEYWQGFAPTMMDNLCWSVDMSEGSVQPSWKFQLDVIRPVRYF